LNYTIKNFTATVGALTAVAVAVTSDQGVRWHTASDSVGGSPPFEANGSAGDTMEFSEALIDAKLEAVEARTETKFAQLLGKMDLLGEKISGVSNDISDLKLAVATVDSKASNTRIIVGTTIIGAFLATAGIVYTVATYSVASASFIKGN
jgi:hypothetical protein